MGQQITLQSIGYMSYTLAVVQYARVITDWPIKNKNSLNVTDMQQYRSVSLPKMSGVTLNYNYSL